jgi:hypothetical protein
VERSETLGYEWITNGALKGRNRFFCVVLTGLYFSFLYYPGFRLLRSSRNPGLCCSALSAHRTPDLFSKMRVRGSAKLPPSLLGLFKASFGRKAVPLLLGTPQVGLMLKARLIPAQRCALGIRNFCEREG